MKKVLVLSLGLVLTLVSCKDNYQGSPYPSYEPTTQVVVTPSSTNLGDGLDLKALGELVKSSPNAQEIENKLNQSGSINNLDLNGDGNVDYITVTEYGSGNNRGFSFVVEVANGEKQEVANVDIEKLGTQVAMNIQGNQQLYGAPVSYRSSFSASDIILMHYLFSYHRPYYSPYRYGYYPTHYAPYRSVGIGSYRTRTYSTKTTTYTRNTSYTPKVKSPNSNYTSKTVSSRVSSLSAPTRSQKSFSTTSASASRPRTSGFGNSSRSSYSSGSSSRSYSPSSSSSSRRSSGSSFFGSSSRSSSSSYRSSSSSSRSSFGSSSRSSSSRSSSRRSDFRFKTDIVNMTSQLDKISKLQGVNYNWKRKDFPKENFTAELQEGFIAQDVEKVYPNLVHTRADGYKTVDYEMLIPSLVEAIKELKAQNAKQDSIIKVLVAQPAL